MPGSFISLSMIAGGIITILKELPFRSIGYALRYIAPLT
jgi:hypothetical protein